MKTSKELADELDAQDRLIARGYTKVPCPTCKGRGILDYKGGWGAMCEICHNCNGGGRIWKAPITK